jgi:hypothetical protein
VKAAGEANKPAAAEPHNTEVEIAVKSLSVSFNNADKDLFRYAPLVFFFIKFHIRTRKKFRILAESRCIRIQHFSSIWIQI